MLHTFSVAFTQTSSFSLNSVSQITLSTSSVSTSSHTVTYSMRHPSSINAPDISLFSTRYWGAEKTVAKRAAKTTACFMLQIFEISSNIKISQKMNQKTTE